MKKILLLAFLFAGLYQYSLGQCGGVTLTVQNPSFEGTPQPHVTPPLWDICMPGCTPDTQPGSWGITLPAANGSTYVGFVDQASANWQEGASQTLSSPMVAGVQYCFTCDLAVTASTGGGIQPGCCEMQAFGNMGGNSGCDQTELLWSSGNVFDAAHMDQWVQHTCCFTPTQPWTHLLFVIHNLGCTDQPYIMMDNLTPIVPVADVAGYTYTNSGGTAFNCLGEMINFHDTSYSSQSTIVSWAWAFGDGSTSTLENPSHTYASAGTFNVTLTIVTAIPCTTSITEPITIYPLPTVTVSGGGSICPGSGTTVPVTFTFTGTGPWDLTYTDGVTPTTVTGLTTSPYTINVSTLGTYTATVVSDAYCTGTSSGSAPVTSNSLTNVTFSPLPNVCVDLPSFPLTGGSPSGGVYSGTGVTAGVFDPATAGPGTFTITYTYTDINGCTNSAQQTIQVGSSLTVTINPTDASICKGGSVNLQCTAANTVHWTPGTGLSDSTVSMVVASPTHTTTYTVTCTTSGGCSGSATITISVYDNTLINFSAVPSEGCQPLKVQFNYTPGLDIIDSSWVWNFDDIISDTAYSTLLNPTHTYILEGDYHVILNATTTAGCLATDTVTVHVYPMPLANFIMHPDIASMDNPAISFVDMSTHASQWSWFFDDPASGSQDYSIIANPVHIFTDSGTYHVILIVETSHGCRDTATKPITIYPELLIYVPNAFTPDGNGLNDQFRPVVSGIYLDTYTMEIFDRWGEEVFKTTDVENGWDGRDHSDKVCESGVFSWIIHYTDLRGKAHKMLGHVSIIR